MELLKTPHQMLLEEAGSPSQTPTMVNTPQQMMMQQSGIMPHYAPGGSIDISPQDMMAAMIAHGVTPQHLAHGGAPEPTDEQFARIIELAKQQPGYLKNAAHKTLGVAGKVFDKLNPAFQVMAALDTGERGINAIERANQGDYRGAAISGLGAIGSGIGMLPGGVPQFLSIPATMGADYLQEHYDETDPHESRFSLKNTTLNK